MMMKMSPAWMRGVMSLIDSDVATEARKATCVPLVTPPKVDRP